MKTPKFMENFDTNKLISNILTQSKPAELSIVLPCRNEQEAIIPCLTQISKTLEETKISAEIIISDSSSDLTINKVKEFVNQHPNKLKIKIVRHNKVGYGNAYLEGFKHVTTPNIFMADCDGTYDFSEIPNFLERLKQGNDFVMGDRFAYPLEKEVMPFTHKYIGNPLLSGLLRLFYKTTVKDSHCGMRAIKTEALKKLNLQTTGMEFASEMVIKSLKYNLKISELPIHYKKRLGESKLNTFADGWRHLRFMLLYSPLFLFFIPGIIIFLIGIITLISLTISSQSILGLTFYIHPMFLSSLLTITGYQLIFFGIFAKTYAITHLGESNKKLENIYKNITIEKAGILGILTIIAGLAIFISILYNWINSNFGELNEIKNSILALTLITLGVQTIFSSFMLSILGIKEK